MKAWAGSLIATKKNDVSFAKSVGLKTCIFKAKDQNEAKGYSMYLCFENFPVSQYENHMTSVLEIPSGYQSE